MGTPELKKKLIITTGDISDVDGFYALALYAKTGADVVFIMNYPGYLKEDIPSDETDTNTIKELIPCSYEGGNIDQQPYGLGFRYNVVKMLQGYRDKISNIAEKAKKAAEEAEKAEKAEKAKKAAEEAEKAEKAERGYKNIIDILCAQILKTISRAKGAFTNEQIPDLFNIGSFLPNMLRIAVKDLLKEYAMYMCKKVWDEVIMPDGKNKGELIFCEGGVNAINPFSASEVKNELHVYYDKCIEQSDFNEVIQQVKYIDHLQQLDPSYTDIWMDFNGSMAFLDNPENIEHIFTIINNNSLKGVVVMGGVYDNVEPATMGRTLTLNRYSCATMNQLYHPANTKRFFDMLKTKPEIPIYVVANNTVGIFLKSNLENDLKELLDTHGIGKLTFLESIALAYYTSLYSPPKKAFDLYSGLKLVELITSGPPQPPQRNKVIMYDGNYGITLVADSNKDVKAILVSYAGDNTSNDTTSALAQKINTMTTVQKITGTLVENVENEKEFLQGYPPENFTLIPVIPVIEEELKPKTGGSKKAHPKPTDKRIDLNGKKRVIYVNNRGREYVKMNKEFITLNKAMKMVSKPKSAKK